MHTRRDKKSNNVTDHNIIITPPSLLCRLMIETACKKLEILIITKIFNVLRRSDCFFVLSAFVTIFLFFTGLCRRRPASAAGTWSCNHDRERRCSAHRTHTKLWRCRRQLNSDQVLYIVRHRRPVCLLTHQSTKGHPAWLIDYVSFEKIKVQRKLKQMTHSPGFNVDGVEIWSVCYRHNSITGRHNSILYIAVGWRQCDFR